MADKPEQKPPAPAEKPAKHGGNMPLMAVIGIVLVLNLLIVGKVFMGNKGGPPPAPGAPGKAAPEEVGKKLALTEFLVNLADPGSDHYLKTTISLGLRKDVDEKKLEDELAPITDTIISVLSSSLQAEVVTPAGKDKLKATIKERLNKKLGDNKVVEIYFTAFATQ